MSFLFFCPQAEVESAKLAIEVAPLMAVVAASAPVTDAKEGLARLKKLTSDCGALLLHSAELLAAQGELLQATLRANTERGGADVVSIFKAGGRSATVFTFISCSGGKDGFDQKGIFYYLGTLLGTPGPWVNPGESGLVDCKWSSVGYNGGPEYYFLDHLGGKSSCTDNSPGQWMQVDLKDVRLANPTHYCLRHGYWNDGRYRLVSWVLSASVDGKVWVEIDVQSNSTSPFSDSGHSTAAFPIGAGAAGQGEGFRLFRVTMKGKNSNGYDSLFCAGFELYGTLVTEK